MPDKLAELFFGYCKGVVALGIAALQPRQADFVGWVQDMKLVRSACAFQNATHPIAGFNRVCREIQNDGYPCIQKGRNMWPHYGPQFRGAANVI